MATGDRRLLESLLKDPEFLELSTRTRELNLFEAVGVTDYEIRHSKFLAFMLDPHKPHGLGDAFLQEFLTQATEDLSFEEPLNSFEFRLRNLRSTRVDTESWHIDILLVDEVEEWVCAIENKVGGSEHDDQLARYKETVRREFPSMDHLFLYLTPEGAPPSHEDYQAVSYETVVYALDTVRAREDKSLTPKSRAILDDYIEIVRRHVMSESEIAEACERIYARHKEAIELIIEHKPSVIDAAKAYLPDVFPNFVEEFDLVEDHHTPTFIRFLPQPLDRQGLQRSEGWTESGRILLFELCLHSSEVSLDLTLGKGDDDFRQKIFDWAKDQEAPFKQLSRDTPIQYQRLYKETLLTKEELEEIYLEEGEEAAMEALEDHLRNRLREDLPALTEAIESSSWHQQLTVSNS